MKQGNSPAPQAATAGAQPASNARVAVKDESIPADAKNFILIEGQEVTVEDTWIVNFRDNKAWDFQAHTGGAQSADGRYVLPRDVKGKQMLTCAELADVVKGVIIHADMTADAAGCFRVLLQRGFSTHFMVDWNGVIYQGADPVMKTLHGGGSEVLQDANTYTIGIDMNCMLPQLGPNDNGQPAGSRGERPVIAQTIHDQQWRSIGYTEAQYKALAQLMFTLHSRFPKLQLRVPMDENSKPIWSLVEPDLEKIGIYGHYHITARKFDPGPGMDWVLLQNHLTRKHNSFPVALEFDDKQHKAKTIANVASPENIKELAETYCRNTEKNEAGGYYPVGLSGQWHGGIHLYLPKGAPVLAMFPGRVVVAKNGPETPALGSNNFVLLKHEIAFDPKDDKKVFRFYSLYMHMLEFDATRDVTDEEWKRDHGDQSGAEGLAVPPQWLRKLRGDATTLEQAKVDGEEVKAKKVELDPETGKAKVLPKKKKVAKGDDSAAKVKVPGQKKTDDDEDGDEESAAERRKAEFQPFLDHGEHTAALLAAKVARFSDKANTIVSPGERIGRVGEFGEEAERLSLVHIEIFADESWRRAVDLLGAHSAHWFEPGTDSGDDLMCDCDELIQMILPERSSRSARVYKDFLLTNAHIATEDVQSFYNDDPRTNPAVARIRKAITRHVSEWSDQVDWFKVLAAGQDWPTAKKNLTDLFRDDSGGRWRNSLFAEQIKRQLPFTWLNEEVAKHIGFESGGKWDGVLTHFHPINFLVWLTLLGDPGGASAKKITGDQFRKIRQAEETAFRAAGAHDEHDEADQPSAADDLPPPSEVLQDLWQAPSLPGDWKHQEKPED